MKIRRLTVNDWQRQDYSERIKLDKKDREEIEELGKRVNWAAVEKVVKGEEKFFVVGEGLHLIKNLLRVDEGTVLGLDGYLEKMAETLIGEILRGRAEAVMKKNEGKIEAKKLFERFFKRRHGESRVGMGGGWNYVCPEAFWMLVSKCFEWKWRKIVGRQRWGFLRKKTEEAKRKTWKRIEEFLKPEIPERLYLPGDKDEEMVKEKMLKVGVEKELIERILEGKLGVTETVSELIRRGVPAEVIDRLIIREEYLEGLKELYRV